MKQRILNLLLLVCCLSVFSYANETGQACETKKLFKLEQGEQAVDLRNEEAVSPAVFNPTPLDTFVLSI